MGEKYGNSLSIMDIGCGVGGPLAFSTTLGICIILISLGLNLVFVILGWTKTLNVDIWNFFGSQRSWGWLLMQLVEVFGLVF